MSFSKHIHKAVPFIGISRHRIDVDGEGVTTLVCFHGCPLHCKWCMNQICHKSPEEFPHYTPKQLYEIVKVDNLYFLKTNGGICFGGGEPLLQVNFISEFRNLTDKRWKITAETSLYVRRRNVRKAARLIDVFIVDIKESDYNIYKAYTGGNCKRAWNNLKLLLKLVGPERIQVRVPRIVMYNTTQDVKRTVDRLTALGIIRIELFDYEIYDENGKMPYYKATRKYKVEAKEKPLMGELL